MRARWWLLGPVAVLVMASGALAQVTPEANEPLRPRMKLPDLALTLRPPNFWQETIVPGTLRASWSGPMENGFFPVMELIGASGEVSLDAERALFRSRVRVRMLERGGAEAQLLQETERLLDGRPVLEQLFEVQVGGKKLSAVAWHFSSAGWNDTFIYLHEQAAFDATLPLATQVAESIVLAAEEPNTVETVATWSLVSLLTMAGGGYWFMRVRRNLALREALPDVANLQLAEDAKGSHGLSFGDDEGELDAPVDEETGFKILDLTKRPGKKGNSP